MCVCVRALQLERIDATDNIFHDCDCFGVAPVVICSLVLLSVLCIDCPILEGDVWESPCRVDTTPRGEFFGDNP